MFSKRFSRALAVTTAGTLIMASAAFADTISNNLDGTVDADLETMNLSAGGSTGSVVFRYIETTGDDSKSGCNLQGSGSQLEVGVSSSNTSVATVSPTSLTFASCGELKTVTITPEASGTATVSLTYTDVTTNTAGIDSADFNLAPASFTVNVASAGNTQPTVAATSSSVSVDEGSPASMTGTWADADSGDVVTLTASVGIVSKNADGTWSWAHTPTDGPDDSQTVTITATDDSGAANNSNTATFGLTVNNVAPSIGTLTLTGGSATACLTGNQVNLQFAFSDPAGANDTYSGSIAWGDGGTTSFGSSFSVNENHTYTTAGSRTITVDVSDSDNAAALQGAAAVSLLYQMSGILSPFQSDGSSVFKYGSTAPVKVRITDCADAPVPNLAPRIGTSLSSTLTPTDAVNETASTSGADTTGVMRYDASSGQYIYNFATKNLSDGNATYWMYVREALTVQGQVSQKFGVRSK